MSNQLLTIILVALVLGLDAFSLSMGMGVKGVSRRYEITFSTTVGVFHIIMPLIGLEAGLALGKLLGVWAGRVGALVLLYIAYEFITKGYREIRPRSVKFSEGHKLFSGVKLPRQGWLGIIIMGLSVSMDALTVGFSLGTFKMPLFLTVLIMGATAGVMTALGFTGGRFFGRLLGSYAQITGGIVLLLLAVKLAM
ncbi:MAG: manganese efflux pump [Syntrophomonadaceae bacterium]|nr:manganese efflux pump [Syntrophomonadaceae bacterium]